MFLGTLKNQSRGDKVEEKFQVPSLLDSFEPTRRLVSRQRSMLICLRVLVIMGCYLQVSCSFHVELKDAQNVPEYEISALHDLYLSTNGNFWTWHGSGNEWNFTNPNPCVDNWQGVTCSILPTAGYLHVVKVQLLKYALSGTIPASLNNLTEMSTLDLSGNNIGGFIPDTLGQCTKLTVLNLFSNSLTGTIPDALSQCIQLVEWDMSQNLLSGNLSDTMFAQFTQLRAVDLYGNNLTGSLPETLWQCKQIEILYISGNQLTGSISDKIGQLTQLVDFDLDKNFLTGTIPSSLGQCTQLKWLYLETNYLTGSIPSSLGQCGNLLKIELFSNHLTGSIPDSLGQLAKLNTVELWENHLTKSIPDTLGQCGRLELLFLESNLLTGTIPSALGNCSRMTHLELNANKLTGTIPATLGQCSKLTNLVLLTNKLTGTIPDTLGNCTQLLFLYLSDNSLEGTIPNLGRLTQLEGLYLYNNQLTGTIPASLSQCRRLEFLNLYLNQLTGGIPDSLAQCTQLSAVYLYSNQLTGSIPTTLGQLAKLTFLDLHSNQLSGSIPGALGQCTQLLYSNLNTNQLTGSIPVDILQSSELFYLYLYSNYLTGTIPNIQGLGLLQVLMLQSNKLHGNIAQLFDAMNQTNLALATIQLSSNQLTGTLPAALFALPSLSSFAAVDNCWDGPLPADAICSSATLTALVLDGMHSASSCRHTLSLYTKAFKLGTVPPCLFSMPNLTTLHLSGNGLTGTLPAAEVNISTVLTDLSLSHNLLSGEISQNFLNRDWAKLDLSYNRLTGTLLNAKAAPYDNTTELYLKHNLLSGTIPSTVQRVGTLYLLESNLFSCRVDRSDVPEQDPESSKYNCGSDAVNNALYAWLASATLLAAIAVSMACRGLTAHLYTWLNASLPARLSGLMTILRASDLLSVLGATNAAYCVLVLLPVYTGIGAYYPTFTYKYAWTVSGAFLSGVQAFAVQVTFLFVLLVSCGVTAHKLLSLQAEAEPSGTSASSNKQPISSLSGTSSSAQLKLESLAALLLSSLVVSGINTGFVFATLNLKGRELTAIQILLAVFKLGFNNVVAPALHQRANAFNPQKNINPIVGLTTSGLLLVLLNVIVIPCVVVVFISPDCFYNALVGTDSVTSIYPYSSNCLSFVYPSDDLSLNQTVECAGVQTAVDHTEYQAAFTYSYQCSSSFVTYYTPTFVIMCIITGFLVPAQRWLLLWLRRNLTPGSRLHRQVIAATPRILKELPSPEEVAQSSKDPKQQQRLVFNANQVVTSLLTYLALLLTFGALFPPLAVCCAVTMASVVLMARLEVGRYITAAVAAGRQDCVDEIERACVNVAPTQQLRVALSLVVTISCMFYTLFLFDTLGDKVGFAGAFWVLIAVPVLPLLGHVLHLLQVLRNISPRRSPKAAELALGSDVDPEFGSEMSFTRSSASAVNSLTPRSTDDVVDASNPMHAT